MIKFASLLTGLVVICFSSCVSAADEPLATFNFNAGRGAVVRNAGAAPYQARIIGAKWERRGKDLVLHFNGIKNYVDAGNQLNDKLKAAGTLVVSYRADELVGGLAGWSSGMQWPDQRCVLSYNTYGNASLLAAVADGREVLSFALPPTVPAGEWTQLALVYDSTSAKVYQDGLLVKDLGGRIHPDLGRLPLWIGRSQGFGKEYFKGVIESVRVYDHALSEGAVIGLYKASAQGKGKNLAVFEKVIASYTALNEPGWAIGKVSYGGQRPLDPATKIIAEVKDASAKVAARGEFPIDGSKSESTIKIDLGDLPAGNYTIATGLASPGQQGLSAVTEAPFNWPGRAKEFQHVRVLNNLVWELLDLKDVAVQDRKEIPFIMPKKRWIHVTCDADAPGDATFKVSLKTDDQSQEILTSSASHQTMRALDAGPHTLVIASSKPMTLRRLTIRSIPELIYSEYQSQPLVRKFGPYDRAFLEKYVLPNVNTLVLGRDDVDEPFVPEWIARGGKWLLHALVPGIEGIPGHAAGSNPDVADVDATVKFLTESRGFTDPRFAGIIADEFGDSAPNCAMYADALMKMAQTPSAAKEFYPYANALYTGEPGIQLIKAIMATGDAIAVKNYLPTNVDEARARQYMQDILIERARKYNATVPGSINHLIMCIGYFSAPPEFLNVSPNANYNTWLDMQFNAVANDPVFWGTYGVMTYLAGYADEETVRWAAHLQRHYGIDGAIARATDDPYLMHYMKNSDFADGTTGWDITPAETGSVRTEHYTDLGWIQGRYPRTTEGDTCLVMRRTATKPNVITQKLTNLQPGRLYCFRMIASDFKDMSEKKEQNVSVRLDKVTMLPEKSFTQLVSGGHDAGPYTMAHPAWMTYFRYLFRATDTTATLTITDWKSPTDAGGPQRQEILINFAHITPYYSEKATGDADHAHN